MTVQYGVGERGFSAASPVNRLPAPKLRPPRKCRRIGRSGARDLGPSLDAYNKERSPLWSNVTVQMLSAANRRGQGVHPRRNFEGFRRGAFEDKWPEVHGLEHWTEFYTRYGVTLQKRFFDHFLKGADNGWKDQPLEIFGRTTTLHAGGDRAAYLLLPVLL
jgi:predicted acyl esterase